MRQIHNVVIEFSTSFNDDGSFKQYEVVTGSSFNFSYNETLDSAVIVLSQVKLKDRLTKIKPYDFVRVYDTLDESNSEHIYLIDNYNENEDNIFEHIFSYTINLMSETKILEKIQLPSRTITHRIKNGIMERKTIYQYICEYIELYCPKVKKAINEYDDYGPWGYERLISVPPEKINGEETAFFKRFNVTSADLSIDFPTLREALTSLMQQVGCIPTVRKGVLGFLDFQIEAAAFALNGDNTINYTVNKISKSLSSDSYANNLVDVSSSVLDSGNEVISETIGFRDRDNLLLKQQENLVLETKFPIYKINKFEIANIYGEDEYEIPQTWQNDWSPVESVPPSPDGVWYLRMFLSSGGSMARGFWIQFGNGTTLAGTRFIPYPIDYKGYSWWYWGWKLVNKKIHFNVIDSNNNIKEIAVVSADNPGPFEDFDSEVNNYIMPSFQNWPDLNYGSSDSLGMLFLKYTDVSYFTDKGVVFSNGGYPTNVIIWIEADEMIPVMFRYDEDNLKVVTEPYPNLNLPTRAQEEGLYGVIFRYEADIPGGSSAEPHPMVPVRAYFSVDITDLVVESSQRGLLNRDFLAMGNNVTQLAKSDSGIGLADYVYGTVGYSIGSKKISGFSTTYTQGQVIFIIWFDFNKTYIENILNFIATFINTPGAIEKNIYKYTIPWGVIGGTALENFSSMYPLPIDLNTMTFDSINFTPEMINNFSYLLFNIKYQPLNSFNLSFIKKRETIDILLQQLNSGASGNTDFDRLSAHQQEVVDRIGNETLVISQRTTNFNDIRGIDNGPLYYLDDLNRDKDLDDEDEDIKYIIYKYSYQINNNYYVASYTASKDSILKNYFTSIRTKYRAYQYVDFEQSILRKENNTFFVLISEKGCYLGDDMIRIGEWSQFYDNQMQLYSYFIDGLFNRNNYQIKTVYERDAFYDVAYRNDVSMITNDNLFALIYEDFDNAGPGIFLQTEYSQDTDVGQPSDFNLGGVPQKWFLYSDEYNKDNQIIYAFYSTSNSGEIADSVGTLDYNVLAYNLPKDSIVTRNFLTTYRGKFVALTLCNDNTSDIDGATLSTYKDDGERMQRTLEFVYYTDSKNIVWTELFIKGNTFVNRAGFTNENLAWCKSNNLSISSNISETLDEGDEALNTSSMPVSLVDNESLPYLKVDWSSLGNATHLKIYYILEENGKTYYQGVIAFKKGEENIQKFYVTLNDTKSNYVLGKRNNIWYRKALVDYNPVAKTYHIGKIDTTFTFTVNAFNSTHYLYSVTKIAKIHEDSVLGRMYVGSSSFSANVYYGDLIEVEALKWNPEDDYILTISPRRLFYIAGENTVVEIDCRRESVVLNLNTLGAIGINAINAKVLREQGNEMQWISLDTLESIVYYGEELVLDYYPEDDYIIEGGNQRKLIVNEELFDSSSLTPKITAYKLVNVYEVIGSLVSKTVYHQISEFPEMKESTEGLYALLRTLFPNQENKYYQCNKQTYSGLRELYNLSPNSPHRVFYKNFYLGTNNFPDLNPQHLTGKYIAVKELRAKNYPPTPDVTLYSTDVLRGDKSDWVNQVSGLQDDTSIYIVGLDDLGSDYVRSIGTPIDLTFRFEVGNGTWDILYGTTVHDTIIANQTITISGNDLLNNVISFRYNGTDGATGTVTRMDIASIIGKYYKEVQIIAGLFEGQTEILISYETEDWKKLFYPATYNYYLYCYYEGWFQFEETTKYAKLIGKVENNYYTWNETDGRWGRYQPDYQEKWALYFYLGEIGWDYAEDLVPSDRLYDNHYNYYKWNGNSWIFATEYNWEEIGDITSNMCFYYSPENNYYRYDNGELIIISKT